MIHKNFITRDDSAVCHIYELHSNKYSSIKSVCGIRLRFSPWYVKPGDGRPVCVTCARIALKRGWV